MYGDFLVPTNTNVNNALTTGTGAKWEKVETLDVNGGDIFEYDVDIDNKTPLNINGIMFVSSLTHTGNFIFRVLGKDNSIIHAISMAGGSLVRDTVIKAQDKNGLMNIFSISSAHNNVLVATNEMTSVNALITPFTHDYFKLSLTPSTGVTDVITGTIDVYFLRGV